MVGGHARKRRPGDRRPRLGRHEAGRRDRPPPPAQPPGPRPADWRRWPVPPPSGGLGDRDPVGDASGSTAPVTTHTGSDLTPRRGRSRPQGTPAPVGEPCAASGSVKRTPPAASTAAPTGAQAARTPARSVDRAVPSQGGGIVRAQGGDRADGGGLPRGARRCRNRWDPSPRPALLAHAPPQATGVSCSIRRDPGAQIPNLGRRAATMAGVELGVVGQHAAHLGAAEPGSASAGYFVRPGRHLVRRARGGGERRAGHRTSRWPRILATFRGRGGSPATEDDHGGGGANDSMKTDTSWPEPRVPRWRCRQPGRRLALRASRT
jgi:hypothetical protein